MDSSVDCVDSVAEIIREMRDSGRLPAERKGDSLKVPLARRLRGETIASLNGPRKTFPWGPVVVGVFRTVFHCNGAHWDRRGVSGSARSLESKAIAPGAPEFAEGRDARAGWPAEDPAAW